MSDWQKFWAPQPIWRLEFLRTVLPLVILGFFSTRLVHADFWLSTRGFTLPNLGGDDWRQPLYIAAVAPGTAWLLALATVIAGLCTALGFYTRVSSGVFAALLTYLALADRLEAFSVSKLSPVLMLAIFFAPAGARYSLDEKRRGTKNITHAPAGTLRFLQALLVVIYSASGIAKVQGDWLDKAVLWSHVHDNYQTPVAHFLVRVLPPLAWTILQWATLVFEVGAPLWFCWRVTRPFGLLAGVTMHAFIGLMFGPVIWFALLMATLLIGSFADWPLMKRRTVAEAAR